MWKKNNLEGSLPTYKYLHWLAVQHEPLGYKQFDCAGGSYRVISEKPLPWKEILVDSWLRVSSWNCFQQVCLLFNRQATPFNLPFNKNKVSYTFSTLPLSICSGTNLRVIISMESCRLFYWKKSFQKFLLKHHFEDYVQVQNATFALFQLPLYFPQLLRPYHHSSN